jgi:hypothetical protein
MLPDYLPAQIGLFQFIYGLVVPFPYLTKLLTGFSTNPLSLHKTVGPITHSNHNPIIESISTIDKMDTFRPTAKVVKCPEL